MRERGGLVEISRYPADVTLTPSSRRGRGCRARRRPAELAPTGPGRAPGPAGRRGCARAVPLLGVVPEWQRRPDGPRAVPRLRRVALVGIDGSGKTTQAHRLAADLDRAGVAASYWRNAGGRRWFGRLARRLGRGADAERLLGRGGMLVIESVLRWLAIARALLRSLVSGQVAVMDRYSVCQYASIRAHRPHHADRWERLARLAFRIFPEPDVTFLLRVDPKEAYRRIERRGTDHESVEFLTAADAAYRSLPEYAGLVVVDGDAGPEEVSRAIRQWLARRERADAPPRRSPALWA